MVRPTSLFTCSFTPAPTSPHYRSSVPRLLARAYNTPLVGASRCAYSTPDDDELLELLSASDQKRLSDDAALERPEPGQHFKSSKDVAALFADAPHLLE